MGPAAQPKYRWPSTSGHCARRQREGHGVGDGPPGGRPAIAQGAPAPWGQPRRPRSARDAALSMASTPLPSPSMSQEETAGHMSQHLSQAGGEGTRFSGCVFRRRYKPRAHAIARAHEVAMRLPGQQPGLPGARRRLCSQGLDPQRQRGTRYCRGRERVPEPDEDGLVGKAAWLAKMPTTSVMRRSPLLSRSWVWGRLEHDPRSLAELRGYVIPHVIPPLCSPWHHLRS